LFTEKDKEAFITMFLYARKMNENQALILIQNYYQFRKEHNLWFCRLEPYDPKIQMAIQDGFPSVLPNLDRLVLLFVYELIMSNYHIIIKCIQYFLFFFA
jgi:hypothetical protein